MIETVNMVFEKSKVPSDFRTILIEPLFKKGDKSECGNYKGISLVSVGNKLLSMMTLFRLRFVVD